MTALALQALPADASSGWSVTLVSNRSDIPEGETATLTAYASQTVTGTPYDILIFAFNAQSPYPVFVTSCTGGSSCSGTAQWLPPHESYIAFVAPPGSYLDMSTTAVATSSTVVITSSTDGSGGGDGGGGGPQPWSVTLTASPAAWNIGESLNLVASANQGLGGSGYTLSIYALPSQSLVGSCTTGTGCSVTAPWSPTDNAFEAFVADNAPTVFTPANPVAISHIYSEDSNYWGIGLNVLDYNVYAHVTRPVGPATATKLIIWSSSAGTLAVCTSGHACGATRQLPAGSSLTIFAFVVPQNVTDPRSNYLARSRAATIPTFIDGSHNPSENCDGDPCAGDPVYPSTGSYHEGATDIAVPGRGPGLSLSRSYDTGTAAALPGRFGFGWSDANVMALRPAFDVDPLTPLAQADAVEVEQEDGSTVRFAKSSDGSYNAPSKVLATLKRNSDGSFTFARRQTAIFAFDSRGNLTRKADLRGNATAFGYDAHGRLSTVTDQAGRALTYSYTSGGLVAAVHGPGGRAEAYGYDAAGNLTSATDQTGAAWRYTYDSHHLMASITDPAGAITRNTYDGLGRVISQTDAVGKITTFAYGDGVTTMTSPEGDKTAFTYTAGFLTARTIAVGTPQQATWQYLYDPNTYGVAKVTDPLGRTTTMTYDSHGRAITKTAPDGGQTHIVRDALGDPHSVTDALGRTTHNTFSASGDLLTSTDPAGAATTNTYDAGGDLLTSENPDGAITAFTWDGAGNVISRTDANGDSTRYTADSVGDVTAITDPLGHTSHLTYDSRGWLTTSTDAAGDRTSYAYDAMGRRTSTTDATGLTWRFTYDLMGRQTKSTNPDGSFAATTYDGNGRVIAVSDAAGNSTHYTWDAAGRQTAVTDPLGATTSYGYDSAGQLTSSTTAGGHTTAFGYDAAGHLTNVTDPLGGASVYAWNLDGERTSATDPDGNQTGFAYDPAGRLTTTTQADGTTLHDAFYPSGLLLSHTDAAGGVTHYAYDDAGQQTSVTRPGGAATAYAWDADGRLHATTDPNGVVATNTYDAAGRRVATGYSDGTTPSVTYSYDAAGRRLSMHDGTGASRYEWDGAGRLATVTNGNGDAVSYGYNGLGQVTSIGYPDGRVVTRGYDGAGRLTSVKDGVGNTTSFTWDGDGELVAITYPNGVVQHQQFDNASRLTASSVADGSGAGLASFAYGLSAAGNVTSEAATGPGLPAAGQVSRDYSYDTLSRLASVSGGPDGGYGVDPVGNVTSLPGGWALAHGGGGAAASLTSPGGVVTTYGVDAAGQRISATGAGSTAADCVVCVLGDGGRVVSLSGASRLSTGGVLAVNSVADGAVRLSGSSRVSAPLLTGPGSVDASGTAGASAERAPGFAPDPLDGWLPPAGAMPAGEPVRLRASGGDHLTAQPGVYSQLTVSGAADVTLSPGVYVITDRLAVTGSGHLHGAGATVVLACDAWPASCAGEPAERMSVSGNAGVALTGGVAGPGAGVVLAAAPGAVPDVSVSGSGNLAVAGVVHVPAGTVTVSGSGVVDVDRGALVTGGLGLTGSAAVRVDTAPGSAPVTSYGWDGAGHLTSVSGLTRSAAFGYDGDGLLAAAAVNGTVRHLAWDGASGGLPVLLSDGAHDVVYGPGGLPVEQAPAAGSGGQPVWLHTGRLGSVRLATTRTGAVAGAATYGPYGVLSARTGVTSVLGYAGQYSPVAGLVFMRARWYDPATTQFLSVDPVVDVTGQPYAYANTNPATLTDPTGLHAGSSVDQAASGYVAYMDNLTFGLTRKARHALGVDNNVECQTGYQTMNQWESDLANFGDNGLHDQRGGVYIDSDGNIYPLADYNEQLPIFVFGEPGAGLGATAEAAAPTVKEITALVPNGETLNSWGNRIWGTGASGAESLIGARSAAELEQIGLTVNNATVLRDFYKAAAAAGKGGATSSVRVQLLNNIIKTLEGSP